MNNCLRKTKTGWTWICPVLGQTEPGPSDPDDQGTKIPRSKSPRAAKIKSRKNDTSSRSGERYAPKNEVDIGIENSRRKDHPSATIEVVLEYPLDEVPYTPLQEGGLGERNGQSGE